SRSFAGELPPAVRLGALYEETSYLRGGRLDRAVANERWRGARVSLAASDEHTTGTPGERAARRRRRRADPPRPDGGRADAGASAAELLEQNGDMKAALAVANDVLRWAGEGEGAMRCRRVRYEVLNRQLELTGHASRLPATRSLHVRARNLNTLALRA